MHERLKALVENRADTPLEQPAEAIERETSPETAVLDSLWANNNYIKESVLERIDSGKTSIIVVGGIPGCGKSTTIGNLEFAIKQKFPGMPVATIAQEDAIHFHLMSKGQSMADMKKWGLHDWEATDEAHITLFKMEFPKVFNQGGVILDESIIVRHRSDIFLKYLNEHYPDLFQIYVLNPDLKIEGISRNVRETVAVTPEKYLFDELDKLHISFPQYERLRRNAEMIKKWYGRQASSELLNESKTKRGIAYSSFMTVSQRFAKNI
jgi:deoxyadenosine/deoxycytidine kinase